MMKKKQTKTPSTNKSSKFWQVSWVTTEKIKNWKENPRINNDAQALATVIKSHGLKSPIVVWEKSGEIYKGNTTYKACLILKGEGWLKEHWDNKIPVIFHNFPSEIAAAAYGIADNKTGEFTGWDDQALDKLMSVSGMEHYETGFSIHEKNNLMMDHKDLKKTTGKEIIVHDIIKIKVPMKHRDTVKELLEELFEENPEFEVKL